MRFSRILQIILAISIGSFFLGSCSSDEQTGSSQPTVNTEGLWVEVGYNPDQSYFQLNQIGVTSAGAAFLANQKCTPNNPKYEMSFYGEVTGNKVTGSIATSLSSVSCFTTPGGNCDEGFPTEFYDVPVELEVAGTIYWDDTWNACLFRTTLTTSMPDGGICDGDEREVYMYYCRRETQSDPCTFGNDCPVPTD